MCSEAWNSPVHVSILRQLQTHLKCLVSQVWILQENHIAWLLIIQHTSETELNLTKMVESRYTKRKISFRSTAMQMIVFLET